MSKNGNGLVVIGLGLGLGALLLFSKKAKASKGKAMDYQLTNNFWHSEMATSVVMPEIFNYVLTPQERINELSLARLLQKVRDKTGKPVTVTSGGRPLSFKTAVPRTVTNVATKKPVIVPAGANIDDLIRAEGYEPTADSDHHYWGAADITLDKSLPAKAWTDAYELLKAQPETRQAIIYYDNKGSPTHIHVSVTMPGRPKYTKPELYAFTSLEAKGLV